MIMLPTRQSLIMPQCLSIIAAVAQNGVIGRNQRLPWHLPADLAQFKQLTWGKPLLMGRRTFLSLPGLLPNRQHFVLSRDPSFSAPGIQVAPNLESALAVIGSVPELMIIGGATVYEQALPLAHRLYLTIVEADFTGDTFFPAWHDTCWRQISHHHQASDEHHDVACSFLTLERTMADP
jgi:dihydrofolate reductase